METGLMTLVSRIAVNGGMSVMSESHRHNMCTCSLDDEDITLPDETRTQR